jgi:uncharacterized protein YbjT (DUF2867 family)
MCVIAGVTEHVGSVAAKELLAKKKPVKAIVRDAKKRRDLVKAGSVLRHVPRECGLHQDTKN